MTTATEKNQPPPTLEQVEKLKTRCTALKLQASGFAAREEHLTKQIANVHAESGDKGELDTLTQQRREVREARADALEAFTALQGRIVSDLELACTAEAVRRTKGIKRAFGSLRQEMQDDEVKVQEAAAAYRDAVNRVNDRYRSLAKLKAEAAALTDRFGVAAPTLPPIVIPAMHDGCREAARPWRMR